MAPLVQKMLMVRCLIMSFALLVIASPSWAQEKYPTRAIELVIAFPPGGVTDILGRIFAEEMSKIMNAPVTPVNKGGASGTLAPTTLLKAPKDGYALLVNTMSGMALAPTILKDVAYDTNKDFFPIALISVVPGSLIVKPDSPPSDSACPD